MRFSFRPISYGLKFFKYFFQGLNSSNLTTTTKWTRSTSKQQDFKCPYEPECSCTLKQLECKNFENFKQLDFRRTSSTQQNELIFETIRIMAPKRQELAEDSLDLKGLNIASSGVVELHNISSFFYRANPLKNLNAQRNTIILKIIDSRFQFMLEQNIPLNSRCDWSLIKVLARLFFWVLLSTRSYDHEKDIDS